jgi:predicted nucleic acid-binding protein
MQAYFADTWFFVALFDRRDSHHSRARRLALTLAGATVFTHDAVLTEVLAHFSDDGPGSRAIAVNGVRQAVLAHHVIPASRELFIAGLDLYARRPDKEYSQVDCMSMILMERLSIRHVLTNDHHFSQAGFIVVSQ